MGVPASDDAFLRAAVRPIGKTYSAHYFFCINTFHGRTVYFILGGSTELSDGR